MQTNKCLFAIITALVFSMFFCFNVQSDEYESEEYETEEYETEEYEVEDIEDEEYEEEEDAGEAYEPVSPYEMSFSLKSFEGETETSDEGVRTLKGTFKKFICENQEIAVVSNKTEDGIIETSKYGTIRVTVEEDGGLVIHLMPSQKKQLLKDIRE